MKKNKKVLVVAVHPDDETLGCGGTLLKHRDQGDEIYWLIVTSVKDSKNFSRKEFQQEEAMIKDVAKRYAFHKVSRFHIPTMEVDTIPLIELIKKISNVFYEVKPHTLYLPFKDDAHSDHRKTFEAAYSCTKNFRYPLIKKILMMETISETDFAPALTNCAFVPNYFTDISAFLKEKLKIMQLYKIKLGRHPFPRNLDNIKGLAALRGATAGCPYAESFMLLKEIDT